MPETSRIYQWIRTVSHEDFPERVLAASHQRPILVDLWAEWCSPCVVIAPVLERVIAACAGRVHLAKVEVDVGNAAVAGANICPAHAPRLPPCRRAGSYAYAGLDMPRHTSSVIRYPG